MLDLTRSRCSCSKFRKLEKVSRDEPRPASANFWTSPSRGLNQTTLTSNRNTPPICTSHHIRRTPLVQSIEVAMAARVLLQRASHHCPLPLPDPQLTLLTL